MILPLLVAFLGAGSLEAAESKELTFSEEEKTLSIFHQLSENTFYYYVGTAFETGSLLAQCVWGLSQLTPWAKTVGNESLFLSKLCESAGKRLLRHRASVFGKIPYSQSSWNLNKKQLSEIPALTKEQKQLLYFLEKRWLAKSTGFFSSMIDLACPCFGLTFQVNPDTTSGSYARSPAIKLTQTYLKRMEDWKQHLPHPQEFPLILTRPFDIHEYLPSYLEVFSNEKVETSAERVAFTMAGGSKVIVDLTNVIEEKNPQKWLENWMAYRQQFAEACKKHNVDPTLIVCIQRINQESIGGIRLLPLAVEETEQHYQFLLGWISNFGLSANLIELDRWNFYDTTFVQEPSTPLSIEPQVKEKYSAYLNAVNWKSSHPQKNLMMEGTLQVLKGLLSSVTEENWNKIMSCPTRSSVVQMSLSKIQQWLEVLTQEKGDANFFDTTNHLEQIHANLSSLLEIFTPYASTDFPAIYRNLLTSTPMKLKSLTSCAVHASGMTSVTGIFKAVEKNLSRAPRVLYGENTYFECIQHAELVSKASPAEEASESDLKEVDLILAQFNPVLKRIDYQVTDYKNENIAEILQKSLKVREGKPLTLALDCTLDFIDSPRVASLLNEFQDEIANGILNVICYRSGIKFDLFGMDNYCGAPFYMIHAQTPAWTEFEALLTDPALQTDRLSFNWFCLAYQNAAPQLELYRKQVFDNTRAFLNKVPSRLFISHANYRIIPVQEGADPAFVDIKISGPLHQMKGSALIAGCLSLKCMEGGHPIFYRPSLGLYHPNLTMLFGEECTTMRLTLGLDPAQVDVLVDCFKMIDILNGAR